MSSGTPIAAIRSAAETLQGGAAEDPQAAPQFLSMIDRNATRLQDLVEDVLEVSRIESGSFPINLQRVVLGDVVKQVFSVVGERAASRDTSLQAHLDDEAREVPR